MSLDAMAPEQVKKISKCKCETGCKKKHSHVCTGVFPKSIKLAKVVPTFKSGSSQDINNYRPISLLSVFSKIIEKIAHQGLYLFYKKMTSFLNHSMVSKRINQQYTP